MYDLRELRDANEALQAAFEVLLREDGVDPAHGPLTQVCGYPLRTAYRDRFSVVGIPCYGLAGCDGPAHRAFIVVSSASPAASAPDLRGCDFAVNSMDSNTGMNLPRRLFAGFAEGKPMFNRVIMTGSHRASMAAVASGRADAAAVDCVTFGLHAAYDPSAIAGLRILAQTSASPAIPFVTSRATGERALGALRRACRTLSVRPEFAPLRHVLKIESIEAPSETAYDVLLDYEAEAVSLGYPRLA